jgi:flagellin FlaB
MRIKRLLKNKRGIVGVEAAIVLIAFIIIAAALSYVVINMGFYTAQKTKETMQSGLDESLTALQLDGVVTAKTDNSSYIEYVAFPAKLAAGHASEDLSGNSVILSVYAPNTTLMNIYKGSVATDNTTWDSLITSLSLGDNQAKFAIYNGNNNTVLESTEKAFLVIHLAQGYRIYDYQTVKIEVRTAKGAALTVVRTAPGGMLASSFVDLG